MRGDAAWFGDEGREAMFKRIVHASIAALNNEPRVTWGHMRRIRMKHILLGEQLPGFLGIDHGPIELPGVRATIVQGSIMQAYGRQTSFAPSYRIVTDMSQHEALTILAGGPSERPFSSLYTQDVKAWLGFKYKRLQPAPSGG